MTNSAKYGVNGKWPSTVAVRTHFPSLVHRNYESEKEALELKFKPESHGQKLELFSAGYIDGHCKGVMVQGVFALLDYLGVGPADISHDEEMLNLVASLKYLRANYTQFATQEQCIYEALSQKLTKFTCKGRTRQEAVRMKRLTSKGTAVRDLLFSAIAEYNRLQTTKTVTPEATMLWAQRSWKDHCKKAPADAKLQPWLAETLTGLNNGMRTEIKAEDEDGDNADGDTAGDAEPEGEIDSDDENSKNAGGGDALLRDFNYRVESFCPAQYCGGMNFIAKLVEGLQPGATEVPLVLIDAMGFDGWPGKKIACATICHTNADASFVSSTLAGKVFSMARSNELNIAAFPNFSSAMAEIKQFQRSPQPDYQVCVCLGDGSLIVRESLIQFWSKKHTSFLEQLTNLVDDHNKEFNPKGLKRGAEPNNEETNEEAAETPKKRLRLTTAKTYAELEAAFPERTDLTCGQFTLTLCDSDASLWVGSGKAFEVEPNTEVFGFGSGDFLKGSQCNDVTSDVSAEGRWLLFALSDANDLVVLEKQRTPQTQHLESLTFWNKVMPLNELLKVLEDNGEVNYQVAEHELTKDAAGNFSIKPLSSVCFVLDALKPKKKKAKVASAMTFGAKVNFAKLRGSSNIRIIWRLRRFT
ncbi:unnamed protein product [Durusdinium trenchii]|uniref:Uncharacterized protein n=1 Tax=Durusdinium trenchii TaxID=1381693 RepID=A0ABP0SEX6_9DINO